MSARSIRFFVLGLGLVALQAAAQPVPYTFSSGPSTASMVPELLGSSVSGSFVYDATAPLTFTTGPTANPANASIYGPFALPGAAGFHSSYTALSATLSGGSLGAPFSFSDPRGSTIVSDGGFVSPPGTPPTDFLSLDADPFGPTGNHNIVPFSFAGYTLWNMRLFFLGYQTSDQLLPEVLPGIPARISLDFVETGNTAGSPLFFVFYDGTLVSPMAAIPEPQTYALMLAGLGLLGFAARRRRNPR